VIGRALRRRATGVMTRIYDPIAAASLRELRVKDQIIGLAGAAPRRILVLGCGRGWLAIELALAYPDAEVVGLDADDIVLEGARANAHRAGVELTLVRGLAQNPPAEVGADGSFDLIASSLLFHHLTRAEKLEAFERVRALLAPGKVLALADFGAPHGLAMRAAFVGVQLAHGFDDTADNVRGRYPDLLRRGGLTSVRSIGRWRSFLGTVELLAASAGA